MGIYLHVIGLGGQTVEGVPTEEALTLHIETFHLINFVYPTPSVSWVDSPQGNQGTPKQTNSNSQFAMVYLHVHGILIPIVERIFAKEAMQDRPNIQLQRSFATYS